MRIIYFVIAAIGFASCTASQTVVKEETPRILNHTKPKQPVYDRPKGEVKVISMTYFRIDTIPLIDKPRKRKNHTALGESIHVYQEPRLVDSLDRHLHYHEVLLRNKIEGTAVIDFRIDKAGRVVRANVVCADNPGFEKSAIEDIHRYARFVPLIIDNRPEPARCVIVIEYKLTVP